MAKSPEPFLSVCFISFAQKEIRVLHELKKARALVNFKVSIWFFFNLLQFILTSYFFLCAFNITITYKNSDAGNFCIEKHPPASEYN